MAPADSLSAIKWQPFLKKYNTPVLINVVKGGAV
jgi:hypothetical protein